jgi:hypothetical protein
MVIRPRDNGSRREGELKFITCGTRIASELRGPRGGSSYCAAPKTALEPLPVLLLLLFSHCERNGPGCLRTAGARPNFNNLARELFFSRSRCDDDRSLSLSLCIYLFFCRRVQWGRHTYPSPHHRYADVYTHLTRIFRLH